MGKSAPPTTYNWTIDVAPPTVSLTQQPGTASNQTSATFGFTGTDNQTSLAQLVFETSLDGAPFAVATSPVTYPGLAVGSHTFQVEDIDQAGNVDAVLTYNWTIDVTAPTVQITQALPPQTQSTSAVFAFIGSDDFTPVAQLLYQTSLDGSAFTLSTSPVPYSGLAQGAHTFQVESIDQAGNVSAPAVYNWIVDLTPPTAQITQKPANPTNQTSATFGFTGTDNVSNPAQLTFLTRVDAGAFATTASPFTFSGLAAGSHTFQVEAVDQAGNVGPATSYTWVVELSLPTASITQTPATSSNQASATFTFTGGDAITPANQLLFKTSLDGSAFAPATSPMTLTNLAAGMHTFQVEAINQAGSTSAPASFTWNIDLTAPMVSITQTPPLQTQSSSAVFAFNATDDITSPCATSSRDQSRQLPLHNLAKPGIAHQSTCRQPHVPRRSD